jgi:nicotinamide phosphoribosyltransferase
MTQTLSNCDSYKISHRGFMDTGTTQIYSNLTARSSKHLPVLKDRYDDKVVFFGLQYFVKEYLIDEWDNTFFHKPKEKVISKFKRLIDAYLGEGAVDMSHFAALHDLGYLPIKIKALPEGSRVDIRVPVLTITNTHPDFAWLTNYLETVMSCSLWKPMTTATIIYEYRKLIDEYALKTTGSLDFTMFQAHDFSFRGMSCRQDAAINGAAFLLSSCGTDTIPALELLEDYYKTDLTKEFVATSVPASEHSIACAGTAVQGELESYRKWITKDYPTGIVSLVSDTYDYWKVLTEYLPALKDDILARPVNAIGLSKVVIRPDSGNPADIICGIDIRSLGDWSKPDDMDGWKEDVAYLMDEQFRENLDALNPHYSETELFSCPFDGKTYSVTYTPDLNRHDKTYYYVDNYGSDVSKCVFTEVELTPEQKGSVELLWETFGGTITEQGYKVLDSHIGLIYGDSITLEVAQDVFKRLEAKGFASTNIVFGVGSYTMQYLTRDSLGMAVKATYAEVNGVGYELFKDPITDNGMKKSAKGLLRVEKEGNSFVLYDQQTKEQEKQGELKTVFRDGALYVDDTLSEIRSRLWS